MNKATPIQTESPDSSIRKSRIQRVLLKKSYRILILILLAPFFLILNSCTYGNWSLDMKFICYPNGSIRSITKMYPLDDQASTSFEEVRQVIKNQDPAAEIIEKTGQSTNYLIVRRSYQPGRSNFLKKRGNRWVFTYYKNFTGDNFHITRMAVEMPGWITSTNASVHYGNYTRWEGENIPEVFIAESSTIPFSVSLAVGVFIIIAIMVISIYMYRKERRRGDSPPEA